MKLYYAVYIEELEQIYENGLTIWLNETDNLPIKLDLYAYSTPKRLMMAEYERSGKYNFEHSSDIVILCLREDAIENYRLDPYNPYGNGVIGYYCADIINSSDIDIVWAYNKIPLSSFMELCTQLTNQHIAVSDSEELTQCVRWFTMGRDKRNSIFNIIGRWRGNQFDDLATLTGFNAENLRDL